MSARAGGRSNRHHDAVPTIRSSCIGRCGCASPSPTPGPATTRLAEIARDLNIELRQDEFKWLDADEQMVHTLGVERIEYDALLLAMGAKTWPAFRHAITLDDSRLDDQLHGLIQDLEAGYLHSLAFVAPSRMPWPLPIYELALMTAQRAYDMNVDVSITLVTPEDAPLAVFGGKVSEKLQQVLEANGILTLTSAHCETLGAGRADRASWVADPVRGPDRGAAEPVRTANARRSQGISRRVHPGRRVLSGPRAGAGVCRRGRDRLPGQARRDRRPAGGDRGPRDRRAGRSRRRGQAV